MKRSEPLSPRALAGLVLGVVAGVTALAVVLAGGLRGSAPQASRVDLGPRQIRASTVLEPRAALFGDTVTGGVDVTFDRRRFDPKGLHVTASFGPWAQVGQPTVSREDAGRIGFLRTTYVLRCIAIQCVPGNKLVRYAFRPARVVYTPPAGGPGERLAVGAAWPELVVHSRLDESGTTGRDTLAAPWRADAVSLPAVTYRVSPGWLIGLLLGIGIALVATAAVLAYRVRPRRAPPPPPPPPPPVPRLAPLEQALALLEAPFGANGDGVEERRRALELVADEVAHWGEEEGLEREARRLAWSEADPEENETKALAASVRAHAEEADSALALAEETDGALA